LLAFFFFSGFYSLKWDHQDLIQLYQDCIQLFWLGLVAVELTMYLNVVVWPFATTKKYWEQRNMPLRYMWSCETLQLHWLAPFGRSGVDKMALDVV
jgi:hypothetical protein